MKITDRIYSDEVAKTNAKDSSKGINTKVNYDLDVEFHEGMDLGEDCSVSNTCMTCSCTCSCATCGGSCPYC